MFDFLKREKRAAPTMPEGTVRQRLCIYGQVQGVGFRYRAKYAAQMLDLVGWVENKDDGSVEMEVQGLPENIQQMLPMIQQSDYIQIEQVNKSECTPDPWARGFSVRG
jgi:acylphosphatase